MKYGFIGCGNMGGAIARALRKSTDSIMIADPSPAAAQFASQLQVSYGTSHQVIEGCQRVFLAVKPQIMESVLKPLQALLSEYKPMVITMAAGLEIAKIESYIGCSLPVIRIMPNTPVAVGKGMITYCKNELVTDEMLDSFLSDMQFAGTLDAIPEKLIDAASAVAGCGPAFMYMYIDALADGGVACGLPREKAIEYAAATMAGAAKMVLTSNQHPAQLKDAVCSPGGSTIEGVKVLEQYGLRGAVIDCIAAAYKRSIELGK